MILIPTKREPMIGGEGDYVFYRGQVAPDRLLTMRTYGDQVGPVELFIGREPNGEKMLARFDTIGRTVSQTLTMVANYLGETIHILDTPEGLLYASSHYPTN